ncbi:hypothetical protein PAEPH01_0295 [Pancytospora epiphaga]|nr:hypothetical protein PAEPH01_0295 [Pancytospora epiphaga]
MKSAYWSITRSLFFLWFTVFSLTYCSGPNDPEPETAQEVLECSIIYNGKNKYAHADDMSQYSIRLTAPENLVGYVSSIRRPGQGIWIKMSTSKSKLTFKEGQSHRVKIKGDWPNKQYYKLIITSESGEHYSTKTYLKSGRVFEEVEVPKGKSEVGKNSGSVNWIIIVIIVAIIAFFALLSYCAYVYYPKSYN